MQYFKRYVQEVFLYLQEWNVFKIWWSFIFVDVEPPIFEQCPTTLIFYPDANKDTAFISWDKPVVTDNIDKGLEPTQVSGPSPASEQGVNTYTVIYTVQDLAGNEGKECSFDIVVKRKWISGYKYLI